MLSTQRRDSGSEAGHSSRPPGGPNPLDERIQEKFEPEYDPDDEYDGDSDIPRFPVTHEVQLKDHTKVVSALALDPSGARILSGSHDYDCKLWDFGGMDQRCKPFKSWEPAGTCHVSTFLNYSGSEVVTLPADSRCKIFERWPTVSRYPQRASSQNVQQGWRGFVS